MATTTPNNGWAVPTSTDLVKDGAVAIETLGDAIDTSVGSGLLAWASYTPTHTGITLGTGGTLTFKYAKLGKIVLVRGNITLGTGGTVTGANTITLPATANGDYLLGIPMGTVVFTNNTLYYPGTVLTISTAGVRLLATNAAGTIAQTSDPTSSSPFLWASGHKFLISFAYEVA